MSLYYSSFACPTDLIPQNLPNERNYWTAFSGLCSEPACWIYLTSTGGIFCANFYSKRGPFAPCRLAGCGDCFVPLGPKLFPVRTLVDEEGEILDHHVEKNRFNVGRAGDHLITPFQCELCHFRNIYTRNPSSRLSTDQEALEFFR
jgi:hypothetical protein